MKIILVAFKLKISALAFNGSCSPSLYFYVQHYSLTKHKLAKHSKKKFRIISIGYFLICLILFKLTLVLIILKHIPPLIVIRNSNQVIVVNHGSSLKQWYNVIQFTILIVFRYSTLPI